MTWIDVAGQTYLRYNAFRDRRRLDRRRSAGSLQAASMRHVVDALRREAVVPVIMKIVGCEDQ